MPNNCSTLIQRKQNILQKILRSNSEGKLHNAVAETAASLRVAGTGKAVTHSSSTQQLTVGSAARLAARRSNSNTTDRGQFPNDPLYDTHLPSIRDSNHYSDREFQSQDEFRFHSRSKTHLADSSPKSTARAPTASFSSIFNSLSKRSTENISSPNIDVEETIIPSQIPPSRRSHRLHRGTNINRNISKNPVISYKQSGDSGVDIRLSSSSAETNQPPQRVLGISSRLQPNPSHNSYETPTGRETAARERTVAGPLYQRRSNNAAKPTVKQKINKYRRRSEEVTQAMNNGGLIDVTNHDLSAAPSNLLPAASIHSKQMHKSSAAVRRVSSDAEIQARLEALRLSLDTNLAQTEHHPQTSSRHRVKSPYLHNAHQQNASNPTASSPQTSPTVQRRNQRPIQNASPSSSQHTNHRRVQTKQQQKQQQPQQPSSKQSINTSPGNLYLAFIASRHLSSLEDTVYECDIDHQKLLRIFTWLKGVEDHRHEQTDHDYLLIQQHQRMLDEEDNFSLYSEIQYAVDEIPANTNGKLGERIAPMQFEN